MKVIIVGLPYFSKQLTSDLQSRYKDSTFISLNTYYKKSDKIKFLFHIITADIVHSINGTLGRSRVLEIAMKLKKKIIFHWVGTDLIKSTELYKKNQHNPDFITYPTHITDSPWYVEKLNKLGIFASFIPLKGFERKYDIKSFNSDFNVLCYVSQHRPEYYGIEQLIEIANLLPETEFNIVGMESYKYELPKNLFLHGWVENMHHWINKSCVCLRMPKTDGLSFFVLESLALGRYVAYNQDFKYSDRCISSQEFANYILDKKTKFDTNNLKPNLEIAEKIVVEFNSERVLKDIYNVYNNTISKTST